MQPVGLLTLTDTYTRIYAYTRAIDYPSNPLTCTHRQAHTSVSVFVSPALSALVPLAYTLNGVYYG